ncbi:MAG TPA: hypothetical protein GXZ90_00350 [Clostridiales bacterium]|nr:hypothetical protein [Clostridiales bacterium]
MKEYKIYKGGCKIVYKQHSDDCTSLEYSLDKGKSWHDVPVDIGKINYSSAWFLLKG